MNWYLGQIGCYGFNFAPRGWALCSGNIMSIQQYSALFSLIGTTYGGNGTQTFALPDLRSRTPIGYNGNYPIGESAGVESVRLLITEMPQHTHPVMAASGNGGAPKIDGHVFAQPVTLATPATNPNAYGGTGSATPLNPQSVSPVGDGIAHNNIQPSLAVNFCIALTGVFPSRN